ncbi:hypothetical protein BUALT_Bualt02G0065000 [Buddleja alternifolia]|uniref:CCHC-type domain-containing protein n=1 Tax=Buddleja alternifolia TaxID=168488 RepID=A0AAV6Y524_9LAMI|nr:hypothetical protein BUALT_Bualt02G0065000 [Buddleja alternifolia]
MKIMADPNFVRDRLVALEAQVQRTKALLGQPLETPIMAIFQRFQDLEERVEKLGKSVNEIPSFIGGKMVSLAGDLGILTDAVDMKLEAVNVEISVLKRATESAVSADDSKKVSMASTFLVGDAKLWWRSHVSDDVAANRGKIETWEVLKKELKTQFLPSNSSWLARESLQKLRHTGTVRDYVNPFNSLTLDTKDMSEEDKLFNFMAGLQGWAQTELRRQGVKDLRSAFAAADGLVDFSGIENQETQVEMTPTSTNKPRKGCFICGSMDHRMRDCPKRERLNALLVEKTNVNADSGSGTKDPNSMCDRLVALEARVQRTKALLGQPLETPMVAIFQKFQDLEERIEKLGKSVNEIPSFIEGRMVSLAGDLGILTDAVDMKLEVFNVEINVLKRATENAVSGDGGPSSKLRVPDPKPFGGERSAKELKNFLWDMDTYFQVARVSDFEKVSMASMFLVGDAKLWWRSRVSDDVAAN